MTLTATYATPTEIKAEPGVPDDLDDDAATRLIVAAEDAIDARLGNRTINTTTGRKVDEADPTVEAWQWAKINRATILLAARLYGRPDLAAGRQWQTEKVADVTLSGPLAGSDVIGSDVAALISQSRLYKPLRLV